MIKVTEPMSQEKNISVVWRIKSLDLVSFKAEDVNPAKTINADKIQFQLGLELHVDSSEKKVTVQCPVEIYSDDTLKELLGSIHTKGEYIIENFGDIVNKSNNQLPFGVVLSLTGVTYSSTRGMLCLLSKGTVFEKAIIPIIDPSVFFPKPVEAALKK